MIPHFKTFLAILAIIGGSDGNPGVEPLVNTTLGLIRGLMSPDGDYSMFLGIPYAQVNTSNPFGKAIPQEPFDEVFEAYDDGAICPQIEEFNNTIVGSLDCLHINVYAPSTANTSNPLPVLVYIYGGGFMIGFAGRYLYGPKYLVRHDIVLVTLNYRLGPYGFMCLDSPEVPGNEGLKDQLLALRWIKDNIQAFGGDPDKITISGNSAGGMSVDFHFLSPHEKLFNRGILQSGTSQVSGMPPDRESPLKLAEHFGLVTSDINEAIAFLSQIDTDSIILASTQLRLMFTFCLEKPFDGVDGFLTENWMQAPMPKIKDMPILIGFNNDECIGIHFGNAANSFDNPTYFHDRMNSVFHTSNPNFTGMADLVQRFYLGDEAVNVENIMKIVDFDSDFVFNYPSYRSVARFLDNDASEVYFYMFSHVGERNFARRMNNVTVGGAAHADEIGYLFDISFYETPNDKDQLIVDRMTTMWANFVKFGNPTPKISDLLPVQWIPAKKDSTFYYLNIGLELKLGATPYNRRMAFLDLFYVANKDSVIHPENI